jgi:hypothetical protein
MNRVQRKWMPTLIRSRITLYAAAGIAAAVTVACSSAGNVDTTVLPSSSPTLSPASTTVQAATQTPGTPDPGGPAPDHSETHSRGHAR